MTANKLFVDKKIADEMTPDKMACSPKSLFA